MKERLFLDRINLGRDNAVPDAREKLALVIDANSAGPSAVWCNLAVMGTERAPDKSIRETFIVKRGLEIGRHRRHGSHLRLDSNESKAGAARKRGEKLSLSDGLGKTGIG